MKSMEKFEGEFVRMVREVKIFSEISDGGLKSEDADIPLRKSYLPYKAIQNIIYNTIKSKKFIYGF